MTGGGVGGRGRTAAGRSETQGREVRRRQGAAVGREGDRAEARAGVAGGGCRAQPRRRRERAEGDARSAAARRRERHRKRVRELGRRAGGGREHHVRAGPGGGGGGGGPEHCVSAGPTADAEHFQGESAKINI